VVKFIAIRHESDFFFSLGAGKEQNIEK
jgi:hypothetical protein